MFRNAVLVQRHKRRNSLMRRRLGVSLDNDAAEGRAVVARINRGNLDAVVGDKMNFFFKAVRRKNRHVLQRASERRNVTEHLYVGESATHLLDLSLLLQRVVEEVSVC